MPEMDAPRALVFRPLVKGNEALGTRLGTRQPRPQGSLLSCAGNIAIPIANHRGLWERDWVRELIAARQNERSCAVIAVSCSVVRTFPVCIFAVSRSLAAECLVHRLFVTR